MSRSTTVARMKRRWGCIACIAVSSLACNARRVLAPAEAPDVVARHYLELGARNDLAGARELVVADCRQGPVGDVDAVKMMGGRMTLRRCETTVESTQGDDARVRYALSGSVHSDGGTTTIFGAQVHVGAVNINDAQQSGSLHLVRQSGRWLITCH